MNWRIIFDEVSDAYLNMARDEAILRSRIDNNVPDTIRFYGWEKPSISLGYFQTADREIELENCIKCNIPVVRRITGGRAVFHEREITYSIIVSEENPFFSGTIKDAFFSVSRCFLYGLKLLGITGEITQKPTFKGKPKNPLCFNSVSWYEIAVSGRKIIGSAQTKKKGVILQQGSILLNFHPENMIRFFKFFEKSNEDMINALNQNITGIEKVLGHTIDPFTVRECLIQGFKKYCDGGFSLGELTYKERKIESELYENKYNNSHWNILGNRKWRMNIYDN
ncbi:lipoate--protein ligase family protein [Candidatus Desantisbacteria bacterium]|nr:lipoate--protein ligase family protein [Candidatus Desantisbacteria bacterium]